MSDMTDGRIRADQVTELHTVVASHDDDGQPITTGVREVERTTFTVRLYFQHASPITWREYRLGALVEVV